MSQEQDAALDALQTISAQVYVPRFLEKCAELGVPIDNEQALETALETTALLKMGQAEESTSLIQRGADALRKNAGVPTAQVQEKVASDASLVDQVIANPSISAALDTLRAAAS